MSHLLGLLSSDLESRDFVNHIAVLFDTGAEFTNLSRMRLPPWQNLSTCMTLLANSAEFVDCKIKFVQLLSLRYAELLAKL